MANTPALNHLYFGDCLDVLKEQYAEHGGKGFIDLIYIDPPFNSKRNYNILFESVDMKEATAQKQAFSDTWSNYSYKETLDELLDINLELYNLLNVFHNLKFISDGATAYITTMAIRICYMHKLLKDTGSFYLHCDPTMSHYLKIVCDLIFGNKVFQNEIIWKRTSARSDSKRWNHIHDTILFYSKSENFTWNTQYIEYDEAYTDKFYRFVEPETNRRYASDNLTAAGTREGSSGDTWRGINVKAKGLHWKYTIERLEDLDREGRILWPQKENGVPRFKRYLDEMKGVAIQSIVEDISPLSAQSIEKLGYPTQKPLSLLERIIKASSNEGDVVADFFCGCGTTVAAAQKLNRHWIGVDISHLAVRLIMKRLIETYGTGIKPTVKLHGLPKDIASAKMLAQETEGGRISFQDWVIEVLLNGVVNEKKSTDGGFDGYLTFKDGNSKKQVALIETKSGNVNVKNLREFIQVVDKQKAPMGIFVCFEEQVTREMTKEAKFARHIKINDTEFGIDRIQIITVEDLMNNKMPAMPGSAEGSTFKKAQRDEDNAVSKGFFD